MATDLEVKKTAFCGVRAHVRELSFTNRLGVFFSILRRAFERQEYFACEEVESVAKTTAFISPAALALKPN